MSDFLRKSLDFISDFLQNKADFMSDFFYRSLYWSCSNTILLLKGMNSTIGRIFLAVHKQKSIM